MTAFDEFADSLVLRPYGKSTDKFVISDSAMATLFVFTVIASTVISLMASIMLCRLTRSLKSKLPFFSSPLSIPTPTPIPAPTPTKTIGQQEKIFVASANALIKTLHDEVEKKAGPASSDLSAVYDRALPLLAHAMLLYKKDTENQEEQHGL